VAVALADLKGDHKLALIALNLNDKSMSVMPGNGDGTFGQAQTYSLPGSPRALLAGDLNGDSRVDLAIALDCGQTVCTQPGLLSIFLGRGDGSMAESASYPTGFSPISIASGDLRGSGHSDLVVGNACGEDATCKAQGTALVFANDGTGKLTRGSEISIGNAPSAIALGSLSGSGLDLVVAQSAVNKIAVLHGDGNGGFGAPVAYSVGAAPSSVALADIRGTGHLDVAVSNLQSSTLSVLFGAGNGSLQPAVTVPVGTGPEAVIATSTGKGSPVSLVTANGNTGASPAAVDFTVVARPQAVVNVGSFLLNATPPGASAVNASVTLSVTAAGGAGTPTGSAVFNYSTDAGVTFTPLSDCGGATGLTLDGTGAASCVTQQLPAGSLVLQAHYSGEPTVYNATDSNQVARTVNAAATTVSLLPNSLAPTTDEVVTLTATVVPTTTPAVVPHTVAINGTIAFNDTTTATTLCATAGSSFDAATGAATLTCTVPVLTVATHSLNAVFVSGDGNYTGNTGTLSLPVTAAPTKVSVVPSTSSPTVDTSVTFNVTVAPNVAGTLSITANQAALSGNVTVSDGGTPISTCNNLSVSSTNGTATTSCSSNTLTVGTHSITVQFTNPNSNYLASASTPPQASVDVGKADTSTTVSSTGTWTVNQTVALTATVTPHTPVLLSNTGTVSFSDTGGTINNCSAAVTVDPATGTASCNAIVATAGSHSIRAVYNGDNSYNATTTANATPLPETAAKDNTTTSLVRSGTGTSALNASVTFTATVSRPGGATVPLSVGTVSFSDNGAAISTCASQTVTGGVANCPYAGLPAGSHTITATYSNDPNYNDSPSNFVSQTVNKSASAVTISPAAGSPDPSTVNQSVTFNIVVTPIGNPVPLTGTLTVTDTVNGGTTSLSGCTKFDPATGTESCTTQALVLGSHVLTATYTNDASYPAPLPAPTVAQTVNPGVVGISVTGASPVAFNNSVTFTATITPPAGPTGLNGTVEFTDTPSGGSPVDIPGCSTAGINSGKAICTTSTLSLGNHTITAIYNGDQNFKSPATGNTFPVTVSQATGISLGLVSSSITAVVNQSNTVNFTATITDNTGGSIAGITGGVKFTDNGSAIPNCSAQSLSVQPPLAGKSVPTTAIAVCPAPSLDATNSPHTIAATYSGDNNFSGASGNLAGNEVVTAAATTLGLKSSLQPSTVNAAVTFTATVTFPSVAGGVPLSGTVEFQDTPKGGTAVDISGCSAQPVSATDGTAICTTATLAQGDHTINAIYTDSVKKNFEGNSANLPQTVSTAQVTMQLATIPSGASSATVNQAPPLEIDATLTAPAGAANLTGKVTFSDNGGGMVTTSPAGAQTPICSQVVPAASGSNASGGTIYVVKCNAQGLTAGTHTITATFTQDKNFADTNAQLAKTINVSAAAASLSLGSSSAPTNTSQLNASVTFTATLTAPIGCVSPYLTGASQTGTVNFTDTYVDVHGTTIKASIGGCSAQPVDPNTSLATCTTTTLAEGAHTITATYTDSAGDFTVQSAPSLTQTVSGNATKVTITSVDNSNAHLATNTSDVNDSVTFTAAVTLANSGAVIPSWKGTMAFQVNGQSLICSEPAANGSNVLPVNALSQQTASVTCTTNLLTAPLANITATYANDPNFTGSFGTFQQGVQKVAVAIQLESSAAGASVPAFQPGVTSATAVTFSATILDKNGKPYSGVNQDFVGLDPVKGQVVFTDNLVGHPICTSSLGVLPSGSTGATCTCNSGTNNCAALANGALPDNINAISAQYINDPNTQIGTSINSVNQPVADYSIGNSSAPPVFVSQGFTTKSDPFTPQNITITPASIYDYKTPDGQPLQLTCKVDADPTATTPPVNPPTCALGSGTLAIATPPNPGDPVAQAFVPLVIDATGTKTNPVTAGVYTVTVTAVDGSHLTRTTQFTMSVREVNAPIQLASGTNTSTLSPTPTVTFVLPAGEQVSNFQCLFMAGTGLNGETATGAFNTSCKVNPSTMLGDANSTQPQTVSLNFEIDTGVSSTAAVDRHTTLLVAGVLGLPLFGLLGLIRGRRSLKPVFLSLFALLALSGSVLQMSGCGGSFSSTTTTTSHGTTPPGTYYFRVQGTGTSGQHAQYEAVVVVEVHL
jgi:hypothetical protein